MRINGICISYFSNFCDKYLTGNNLGETGFWSSSRFEGTGHHSGEGHGSGHNSQLVVARERGCQLTSLWTRTQKGKVPACIRLLLFLLFIQCGPLACGMVSFSFRMTRLPPSVYYLQMPSWVREVYLPCNFKPSKCDVNINHQRTSPTWFSHPVTQSSHEENARQILRARHLMGDPTLLFTAVRVIGISNFWETVTAGRSLERHDDEMEWCLWCSR